MQKETEEMMGRRGSRTTKCNQRGWSRRQRRESLSPSPVSCCLHWEKSRQPQTWRWHEKWRQPQIPNRISEYWRAISAEDIIYCHDYSCIGGNSPTDFAFSYELLTAIWEDILQYQHFTEICQKPICRDKKCKFRHPKTCK